MPPEPHGQEDDGISHLPLQPADPQGGEGARRTQGEVEGQVQEGDGPGDEEVGSGERLAGHVGEVAEAGIFMLTLIFRTLEDDGEESIVYLGVAGFGGPMSSWMFLTYKFIKNIYEFLHKISIFSYLVIVA
jgi:hypothetical protein